MHIKVSSENVYGRHGPSHGSMFPGVFNTRIYVFRSVLMPLSSLHLLS